MNYTFEILGVSPVLYVFNQQQELLKQDPPPSMAYLASYRCTLDALLDSVSDIDPPRNWNVDRLTETIVDFWMRNAESVEYWKARLDDAGRDNLLMARVADTDGLRAEFENLWGRNVS